MTLREALTTAVELMRTQGDPDDRTQREAARTLERKAERLRAQQEAPSIWEHRCYCGERRRPAALLCTDCHSAMPMKLLLAWYTGTSREKEEAVRAIRAICTTRIELIESGAGRAAA